MRVITLMSTKHPVGFSVEDDVADKLLFNASNASKSTGETASNYVNKLLKWALENYKEEQVCDTK